jgi:hypothetical protein
LLCRSTREVLLLAAAAGGDLGLVWIVVRQDKPSATSYVMNGVDLMEIAELRAELRSVDRRAAKHREG